MAINNVPGSMEAATIYHLALILGLTESLNQENILYRPARQR